MSYTLDIHQTVKTCVQIYNSNFPNFPNADAHLNSYTGYCKYKYWIADNGYGGTGFHTKKSVIK